MDWDRVEGNWKQIKGKIKEQWGKLTDDDLDRIAGQRDQLEGKIQERYGIAKDRARREITLRAPARLVTASAIIKLKGAATRQRSFLTAGGCG